MMLNVSFIVITLDFALMIESLILISAFNNELIFLRSLLRLREPWYVAINFLFASVKEFISNS